MHTEYKRGTDFDFAGVLTDDDADGAAYDLSGHTIEAQMRQWRGGRVGPLLGALDADVLDGPAGAIRIYLADQTDSAAWETGPAALDVVVITPGGARLPTRGYALFNVVAPATQAVAP